jgi:hypothetical protein
MSPRLKRQRSVHTAEGDVVLDTDSGRMFSPNASGSVILRLSEQGLTDAQIADELVKRFAIPTDSPPPIASANGRSPV